MQSTLLDHQWESLQEWVMLIKVSIVLTLSSIVYRVNRVSIVMVSILILSSLDHGFHPRSDKAKGFQIGVFFLLSTQDYE